MSPLWVLASSSGVSPWGAVNISCGMFLYCPGHCRKVNIPGRQPVKASRVCFVIPTTPNVPTHFHMALWGWYCSETVFSRASVSSSDKRTTEVPQSQRGLTQQHENCLGRKESHSAPTKFCLDLFNL